MSLHPSHGFTHQRFSLMGEVVPLLKAAPASAAGHVPERAMGGWLMTYGKINDAGELVPTVDRDKQVIEAARELGHIDWKPYVESGLWNDTHDEAVIVGIPSALEFHDESSPTAQMHGKVGFWTAGHLWDRTDPASWEAYTDYVPSEEELNKADHYWKLAHMLKGMPRPLALSAHGEMALSGCGSRVIWCRVRQAAVCELPKNPDATLEILAKAHQSPLQALRKGMVGRRACGRCNCPPWACDGLLRKAGTDMDGRVSGGGALPSPGEDPDARPIDGKGLTPDIQTLISILQEQYFMDEGAARRWVLRYFDRKPRRAADGR